MMVEKNEKFVLIEISIEEKLYKKLERYLKSGSTSSQVINEALEIFLKVPRLF